MNIRNRRGLCQSVRSRAGAKKSARFPRRRNGLTLAGIPARSPTSCVIPGDTAPEDALQRGRQAASPDTTMCIVIVDDTIRFFSIRDRGARPEGSLLEQGDSRLRFRLAEASTVPPFLQILHTLPPDLRIRCRWAWLVQTSRHNSRHRFAQRRDLQSLVGPPLPEGLVSLES